MRRLLLLTGLLALVASPALAHQMTTHGSFHHHRSFFFLRHHPFFIANTPFAVPFSTFPPGVFAGFNFSTFPPGVAAGFPLSRFGLGMGGFTPLGAGEGVAVGFAGDYGSAAEPRLVFLSQPASAPPPPAQEAHATVEQTASGVTIIRGPGTRHYAP